jgi:imidazole glycerol-phosphate synthase subunit HisH
MKLAIIDYGVGNIQSILNSFERLGVRSIVVADTRQQLVEADGLILPGVGAFGECAKKIKKDGLSDILSDLAINQNKPILGICVGMQLMANSSNEGGCHVGLGWIPGEVVRIDAGEGLPVPHVGWNDISLHGSTPLFNGVDNGAHFYFDHSYHFQCEPEYVSATCQYGKTLNVAVSYKNLFGVQFHPEKSANPGLKMFRGYLNWISQC